MEYRIGIIGDKESVLGFMTVGFSVRTVENADEAKAALHEMAGDGFGIIFITEEYARLLENEIDKYKSEAVPAVICLPSKAGSTGFGLSNIKKSVENAVGVDILFK